jgi:hypothetical protein
MSALIRIVDSVRESSQLEGARSDIAALPPEEMAQALALAQERDSPLTQALLVIVLVDAAYPPAFPLLRRALKHPDREAIALVADAAFDALAGGTYRVADFWSGERPWKEVEAVLAAIGSDWDAGRIPAPPSREDWLATRRRRFLAEKLEPREPAKTMTQAQRAALEPRAVELAGVLRELNAAQLVAFDADCLSRGVDTLEGVMPGRPPLLRQAINEARGGKVSKAMLGALKEAWEEAKAEAKWNRVQQRYEDTRAAGATQMTSAVLYLAKSLTGFRAGVIPGMVRQVNEYLLGFEAVARASRCERWAWRCRGRSTGQARCSGRATSRAGTGCRSATG